MIRQDGAGRRLGGHPAAVAVGLLCLVVSCASQPGKSRQTSSSIAPSSASARPLPVNPPSGSGAAPIATETIHTLGELLSEPERFEGVEVRLCGVRVTVLETCTEKSCGSGNPCCNFCSAGAYIGVSPQYLALSRADGSVYAASGTNCKLDRTLEVGAGPYSMVGRLEMKAYGPTFRTKSIISEPASGSQRPRW